MKALVTGATGFVGGHLVDRLLDKGVGVVCAVRSTSDTQRLDALDVTTERLDLGDATALSPLMEDVDFVFHVAGSTRELSLDAYRRANVNVTQAVLTAALRSGHRLRRFVLVSSLAAIGPTRPEDAVDESVPPHPISAYGKSKLEAENLVRSEGSRLPITILRPPAVYGPRDRNFLPMFRLANRYGFAPVVGSRAKRLTLVHARDLAAGLWRAATSPRAEARTYFLGSETVTFGEIVDAIGEALQRRVRTVILPAPIARIVGLAGDVVTAFTHKQGIVSTRKVRDMLQPAWECSWEQATREIGYRPAVSLGDGIRETCDRYREEGLL